MKIEKCHCGNKAKKSGHTIMCGNMYCPRFTTGITSTDVAIMWNAAQRALKRKVKVRR